MNAPDSMPQMNGTEIPAPKAGPSVLSQIVELVVMVAIAFALAQLVRAFLVQPYVIPSGSMIPTIEIGDHVLADKLSYRFKRPTAGDVVVLDDPTGETPMLIKRIIAVGGQTVDLKDGKVVVDGAVLDEPYTHGEQSLAGPVKMPVTLPPGTVWVMGDNRTHSRDSRWMGPQPVSGVRGRAFVTYWPIQRMGALR
jgi:signal peptidase I